MSSPCCSVFVCFTCCLFVLAACSGYRSTNPLGGNQVDGLQSALHGFTALQCASVYLRAQSSPPGHVHNAALTYLVP